VQERLQACQHELHSHGGHNEPHEASPMARSKAANVTAAPISAAAIAVTQKPSGVWTAANVTTAVS
jgi:hypothetical protein